MTKRSNGEASADKNITSVRKPGEDKRIAFTLTLLMIGQKNVIVNMGKQSNIYISIFTKKIYMCIKYVLQIYV